MHAFLLCDAAETLYREIPGFELLIVGGGTAFEALKTRADELNRKAGRALVVKLTGARTDVAELIGSADVFVGVSRSALEAMSEGEAGRARRRAGVYRDTHEREREVSGEHEFLLPRREAADGGAAGGRI